MSYSMRTMRRGLLVMGVIGAASAASLSVLTSSGGANPPDQSSVTPAPSSTPEAATPTAAILGQFHVLKQPAAPPTVPLTTSGKAFTDPEWQARMGVNLAHATQSTIAGRGVWVAAGANNVCMFDQLPSGGVESSCAPADYVEQHGLVVFSLNEGTSDGAEAHDVVGIVPDDVDAVSFGLADGSSAKAAVTDNAFTLTTNSTPVREQFESAATGAVHATVLPRP